MTITLTSEDYRKIVEYAAGRLPEEACGMIAGEQAPDGSRKIRKVYLLTNTDHSREHFSMDPREQLAAVKNMREEGLQLLGNWHSHPETPSRPSEEDIRLAHDRRLSYMILSLMDLKAPVLRSFHIEDGKACAEDLEIIQE